MAVVPLIATEMPNSSPPAPSSGRTRLVTVDDIRPCFDADGKGAIITASRSVIYAFDPADPNWPQAVTRAAKSFADQIASAI